MKFRFAWLCILAFVIFVPAMFAQDNASITGTVTDSTGAAIPNAQVTVSVPNKGINRVTTTNGSGDYLEAGLPIGAVDLNVTSEGFKKYQAKGIILRVGEKARVDVSMQVGAATTQVTVEGTSVAQVETQSSDLGGTVSGKEISQLQLNGRVFSSLITLVPGVSSQTGSDEGAVGTTGSTAFSVNGGRTEYNNWELDGGDNMDNGSNGNLNVYPSIDAIGEFKVLTSNYGAQYGKNGSGTVEVETKSGTSAFHGDVYEFVRNDMFNATPYFNNSVPPYKKNDFGYTIGGPVTIPGVYNKNRQKTFFFWSEEWHRDRIPFTFNTVVPSLAERSGNFSDQCPNVSTGNSADCPVINGVATPNLNTLPGFNPSDPNVQGLLSLIPDPTPGQGNVFLQTNSQPTNWREELFRIDHNLTDKERLTFRYVHDSWQTLQETPTWTNVGSFPTIQNEMKSPSISMVARLSSTLSPTLLNEFVASYTSNTILFQNVGNWKRPANMTIGELFATNGYGRIPGINLQDPGGAYGNFGEDGGYIPNGVYNSNPTYSYKDNVNKIVGKHNLQFGAYFEAAQKNELGAELAAGSINGYLTFDPSSSTTTSGNPFADLLLGNIASFGQQNAAVKYYNRYKIVEPYLQDDWHVTSRMTLNLGLRLSLFGTYREKKNQAYNFEPSAYKAGVTSLNSDGTVSGLTPNPNALPSVTNIPNGMVQCGGPGVSVSCQNGHLFNPAPRIGFAYDPQGNGKTAIRGGYGIFYEHGNGNEANTESLENSAPLAYAAQQTNIVGYTNIGGGTSQFPLGGIAIPAQTKWTYVQQWHFDVEHNIANNTVATISYVGSEGTHLAEQRDLNQLHPVLLSQNPYAPGEAISSANVNPTAAINTDCSGMTIAGSTVTGINVNGNPVSGQVAQNVAVGACGANANLFRPFPGYASITSLSNTASSNYNALQIAVRRSVGGLQLNFAYTYSHSIDNSSDRSDASLADSYNPAANRASSNFDQRHVLNFGYVWDLPFFKAPSLRNKLLGGWEYSGITAFNTGSPFSVTYNVDNAGVANGLGSNSYADVVGDPRAGVTQSFVNGFGPVYYNAAAYAPPRGLTFGDSGRNSLRNPSRLNFDMALFKHFAITESKAFEFRAEAFNIFNHTEWQPIAGSAGSSANSTGAGTNVLGATGFFRPNGAHEARILQLGLKFLF